MKSSENHSLFQHLNINISFYCSRCFISTRY